MGTIFKFGLILTITDRVRPWTKHMIRGKFHLNRTINKIESFFLDQLMLFLHGTN